MRHRRDAHIAVEVVPNEGSAPGQTNGGEEKRKPFHRCVNCISASPRNLSSSETHKVDDLLLDQCCLNSNNCAIAILPFSCSLRNRALKRAQEI